MICCQFIFKPGTYDDDLRACHLVRRGPHSACRRLAEPGQLPVAAENSCS